MTIWIKCLRKDGKLNVIYGYSNGVRLRKVITVDKLREEDAKGYRIIGRAEWLNAGSAK